MVPLLPHEIVEPHIDSTSFSSTTPLPPHERVDSPFDYDTTSQLCPPPGTDTLTLQDLPNEIIHTIVLLAISQPITEPSPCTRIPTRRQALTNVSIPGLPGLACDSDRAAFILGPKPADGFAHITGYDMRTAQNLAAVSLHLLHHVRDASIMIGKRQSLQQIQLMKHMSCSPGHYILRCHHDFSAAWCSDCAARLTQTYRFQKCVDNAKILKRYNWKRRCVVWKLELMIHKKRKEKGLEYCAKSCMCVQKLELLAENPRGFRLKIT